MNITETKKKTAKKAAKKANIIYYSMHTTLKISKHNESNYETQN